MMGEVGGGRNTGGDEDAYRRAVESAPDDPSTQIETPKTGGLEAKIESARVRSSVSIIPDRKSMAGKAGKKNRLPSSAAFRERLARQPHPTSENGAPAVDTAPAIKKSEQSEQFEADKAIVQEIIDGFIFIGEFKLVPLDRYKGKYIFTLIDKKGSEGRNALVQKRKTIDEIVLVLKNCMAHNYKKSLNKK